ncbi:hypothetical protein BC830DRAFT_1137738 [Chytriomyces sp. MP71]|nr:hypothetical protein BC830DRAFT_1137738 [Chytriomyces sp. MP71]
MQQTVNATEWLGASCFSANLAKINMRRLATFTFCDAVFSTPYFRKPFLEPPEPDSDSDADECNPTQPDTPSTKTPVPHTPAIESDSFLPTIFLAAHHARLNRLARAVYPHTGVVLLLNVAAVLAFAGVARLPGLPDGLWAVFAYAAGWSVLVWFGMVRHARKVRAAKERLVAHVARVNEECLEEGGLQFRIVWSWPEEEDADEKLKKQRRSQWWRVECPPVPLLVEVWGVPPLTNGTHTQPPPSYRKAKSVTILFPFLSLPQ